MDAKTAVEKLWAAGYSAQQIAELVSEGRAKPVSRVTIWRLGVGDRTRPRGDLAERLAGLAKSLRQ